jgi:hypothetical protein
VQQPDRRDDEEKVMDDWTETRVGRAFHRLVVGPISHEDYRRMIRETYPAQLPPADSGWVRRYGHEVDWTVTSVYAEAQREAWARRTVRAAGKSWATHMAKFSGAVVPRETVLPPLAGPYDDRPEYIHYDVASAEARAGRRGLLDSGPHAPRS